MSKCGKFIFHTLLYYPLKSFLLQITFHSKFGILPKTQLFDIFLLYYTECLKTVEGINLKPENPKTVIITLLHNILRPKLIFWENSHELLKDPVCSFRSFQIDQSKNILSFSIFIYLYLLVLHVYNLTYLIIYIYLASYMGLRPYASR